jgi:hypothetical protein
MRQSMLLIRLLCSLWLMASIASAAQEAAPLEQQQSLGAVHLRLRANRQSLGLADTVLLTLEAEAPLATQLTWPEVPKQLGPFAVMQSHTTGPRSLTPQTQQWQREYVLAPTTTGALTVPALTVEVQDGTTPQTLSTTPLSLTVTSIVPADADPASLKDIAAPVELTRRGLPPWVWLVLGGLGSVALLASAWWYWRRRQTAPIPLVQRPAHTLALAALEQLQRADLIGQGQIEGFYLRVSAILRRYIELRFGLRAPEQTTEEFLTALLHTTGLIAVHRDLLAVFLQQCDLVKFARHRPLPSDMEEVLASATHFVEQTADIQVLVTVPPSGELIL